MKKAAVILLALLMLTLPAAVRADSAGELLRTGDAWAFRTEPDGSAVLTEADHSASGIVRVPSSLLGYRVAEIGPRTILASRGAHIILPEGITRIGDSAFSGTSFSVYIPSSVTEIRASAFLGCAGCTIYTPAGSAAHAFAEANRIPAVTDPSRIRSKETVPSDADYSVYSEACHAYDRGEYRYAFRLLCRIAGPENPHAALLLGQCFTEGRGVGKNKYAAYDCFRIAADTGLARAQYETGRCLMQAAGVSKNPSEAVRYFRMAADQEQPSAWLWLGYCYHRGLGVTQDYDMAEDLYSRADAAGVRYAPVRLDELARDRAKGG